MAVWTSRLAAALVAAAAAAGCSRPAPPASAGAPAFAGDAAHGGKIAQSVCNACHGAAAAAMPQVPRLAAQYPEYIAKQLAAFRSDGGKKPIRTSPVMAPIAAALSPADIRDVASYFALLPPQPGQPRNPARIKLGQEIYTEGAPEHDLPACISCHRPTGAGIRPDFPRIGGQSPDYIDDQLANWMTTRGRPGKLMSMIVPHLQPDERAAVADYIAQLRPPSATPSS